MSKLPSLAKVTLDHEGSNLWPLILSAEKSALLNAPTTAGAKYNDNLIGVRVLGFMLQDLWQHSQHSFGLIPYKRLLEEINSCSSPTHIVGSQEDTDAQHDAIYKLGLFHRNHLIRVFRSNGRPLPTESEHPSRPSLERTRQRLITKMAKQKEDEKKDPTTTADARKESLVRDGFRCMVTGQYDFDSCDRHTDLEAAREAENVPRAVTQCAHIFSESAQDSDKKTDYAASAMAILEMFGLNAQAESLVGRNVHKHFNILTMRSDLHHLFDHLTFWLEEVIGEKNTYKVCSVRDKVRTLPSPPPERVTFKVDPKLEAECWAAGKEPPALPSPALLAIRAACSRVVHMSGAAEQIDQILRDLEDISVMADDGGSATLLMSRLLQSPRAISIAA
ncbi:hypothetical protein DFH08DRAFT_840151 [Mycena albidolilacea]|uniref:HNH nuclease domain-containing protein n=1 Tax=Mycena albidolilacea TaxID=1033008 RepID=A0AAD7F2N3_9AGAR|nr:hypothetical protein DFH08DRAFT_840151 [Mycena albidolilacea]